MVGLGWLVLMLKWPWAWGGSPCTRISMFSLIGAPCRTLSEWENSNNPQHLLTVNPSSWRVRQKEMHVHLLCTLHREAKKTYWSFRCSLAILKASPWLKLLFCSHSCEDALLRTPDDSVCVWPEKQMGVMAIAFKSTTRKWYLNNFPFGMTGWLSGLRRWTGLNGRL